MEAQQTPVTCGQLVNQARNQSKWIYDPSSKEWLNPDEFHDKYQSCASGFEEFFAQCEVRSPSDGVTAGMVQVQRLQDRVTGLMNRIVTYYKQH